MKFKNTCIHFTWSAKVVSLGEKSTLSQYMKINENERRVIITVLIEHILPRNERAALLHTVLDCRRF